MPAKQILPSSEIIPTSALALFLAVSFLITWGLIGAYIIAPEIIAATFGEISGSHPFFFLATWSPAIAAFVVVFLHVGIAGLRAFLSRLLLWRCSLNWVAFILLVLPLRYTMFTREGAVTKVVPTTIAKNPEAKE